jgi:thiamine pyrophosphokinase
VINPPTLDPQAVKQQAACADIVVAADGAMQHVAHLTTPYIVCGDFDSIATAPTESERFAGVEFVHNCCQETSDLEKCIRLALERGATEIAVVGNLSGRLDHALVVMSILERYHTQVPIELFDGQMRCKIVSATGGNPAEYSVLVKVGDTISLIPRVDGTTVTLSGVQWPLTKEHLFAGSRGLSNKAVSSAVSLTVHSGVLCLVYGLERI